MNNEKTLILLLSQLFNRIKKEIRTDLLKIYKGESDEKIYEESDNMCFGERTRH